MWKTTAHRKGEGCLSALVKSALSAFLVLESFVFVEVCLYLHCRIYFIDCGLSNH